VAAGPASPPPPPLPPGALPPAVFAPSVADALLVAQPPAGARLAAPGDAALRAADRATAEAVAWAAAGGCAARLLERPLHVWVFSRAAAGRRAGRPGGAARDADARVGQRDGGHQYHVVRPRGWGLVGGRWAV
jgi:hypothetical protein